MNTTLRKILSIARRGIALTANILLATVTIFSAYGGMINPMRTTIGSLAAMLFPALLALTIVVFIFNIIWFRRNAIVNALSLLICLSPALSICPLHFFRPSAESIAESGVPTLRVLTFNTLNFYTYGDGETGSLISPAGNPTFEYILQQDADIVLLQEADDIHHAEVYGVTTRQHSRLLENYPYNQVTPRGMAILSKYPFRRVPVSNSDINQLDLCRYDVAVPGLADSLHLFNLHMQSLGLTSADKEIYRHITRGETSDGMTAIRHSLISKVSAAFRSRAVQAEDVRRAIDEVTGPVIVAGDFNDIPECYAARLIRGNDLTDAYRAAGLGPCITYHADRFYFRIDHILFRGPFRALRTVRGDCPTSDHYPLLATFEILPQSDN